MNGRPTLRRYGLSVLALTALVVAAGFAAAVVAVPGDPLALHETAGAVLLGLLAALVGWSAQRRHERPSLLPRAIAALAALIAMGALGALLALGSLPPALAGLPLVPLAVMLAILAEFAWASRPLEPRSPRAAASPP